MTELEFRVGEWRFATLSIPDSVTSGTRMEMIAETLEAALLFSRRKYQGMAPVEVRNVTRQM